MLFGHFAALDCSDLTSDCSNHTFDASGMAPGLGGGSRNGEVGNTGGTEGFFVRSEKISHIVPNNQASDTTCRT